MRLTAHSLDPLRESLSKVWQGNLKCRARFKNRFAFQDKANEKVRSFRNNWNSSFTHSDVCRQCWIVKAIQFTVSAVGLGHSIVSHHWCEWHRITHWVMCLTILSHFPKFHIATTLWSSHLIPFSITPYQTNGLVQNGASESEVSIRKFRCLPGLRIGWVRLNSELQFEVFKAMSRIGRVIVTLKFGRNHSDQEVSGQLWSSWYECT